MLKIENKYSFQLGILKLKFYIPVQFVFQYYNTPNTIPLSDLVQTV